MNTLKGYVNYKLTHADKVAEAEGYPLTMQNCKKYKKMKDLKVYGNSFQDGTPTPENPIEVQSVGKLVTDTTDVNYGKYKIPVVQRGINLFNMANFAPVNKTVNGITFTTLDDERIHIKGKLEDTTKGATVYIYPYNYLNNPVKAGVYRPKPSKYTWNGLTLMFGIKKSDGTGENVNAIHSSTEIEVDGWIQNVYVGVSNAKTEWDDIIELQLMEGTQNLPYEPYVDPVTTNIFLDEPLRKLGDYADYIDFKENKVVRRNKEYTVASSGVKEKSYWYTKKGWNAYLYGDLPYEAFYALWNLKEKCSHFLPAWDNSSGSLFENCFQLFENNRKQMFFITTKASDETVEDFKAFLDEEEAKGNPVKIYYRLAEPIEEPLNMELPKLTAKTTIIEVDTSLAPSDAYGKYIKK